jgi:hypothetical protein
MEKKEPFFEVGEEVSWTSQAMGSSKTKTGRIVAIVEPGQPVGKHLPVFYPVRRLLRGMDDYVLRRCSDKKLGGGGPRDHFSYLIRVKRSLYWPRVEGLRLTSTAKILRGVRAENGARDAEKQK